MPKITMRTLKALSPSDRDYFVWDSELEGFGVRVWPSGAIKFVVQQRIDGKTVRRVLGTFGPFTVEAAKKRARDFLQLMETGQDPKKLEKEARSCVTVAELCDEYLIAAEKGLILGKGGLPKKASTLDTDKGRIKRHIKPLLGSRLVNDLTPADINQFIEDVTLGKTAMTAPSGNNRGIIKVTGGSGTATRTVGLLGGILARGVAKGLIRHNPAHGVQKPSYRRRERRLTPEEYRRLGNSLRDATIDGEHTQVIDGIWILVLSGFRLGEAVKLKWSEIDFAGGTVRLEDSKEGASVRPIGKALLTYLADIERAPNCTYVLPAKRYEGHFGGIRNGWNRVAEHAGFEDVTPHTLRRSFSSVAGDLGYSDSTIASLLGHAKGTVTSRYIINLDSVLIAAADRVAAEISRMMGMRNAGTATPLLSVQGT